MAIVSSLTKERMLAIEAASVVAGEVDGGGDLILEKHDGSQFNAGHVVGPKGDPGTPALEIDASTTTKGNIQIATTAEVLAGTNAVKAVTPSGLSNRFDLPYNQFSASEPATSFPKGVSFMVHPPAATGWPVANVFGVVRTEVGFIEGPGGAIQYWNSYGGEAGLTSVGSIPDNQLYYREWGYNATKWGHWKLVATGRPKSQPLALSSSVISYSRGWNDNNWEEPSYTFRNGFVQFNGLLALSVATAGTVIATIPPEIRPDTDMIFLVDMGAGGRALYIRANGNIELAGGFVANSYISLSKIFYPVAGRANWTTIPSAWYVNGWTDFYNASSATNFGTARYWIDETGYMWLAGLIKGGTMNVNSMVWPVGHAGLSDSRSGHVATASTDSFSYVYFPNNVSRVLQVGAAGANTWVSLAGVGWPTASMISSLPWITGVLSAGAGGGRDSALMGMGWVNYDASETTWSKFKIAQNANGMVITRGLISSGSFSGGQMFLTLKDEWTRKKSIIMPSVSNQAFCRIDVQGREFAANGALTGSSIFINSGSTAWLSFDGMKWFPE